MIKLPATILIGLAVGLQLTPVQGGVERHDPFLRCVILVAIAGETPTPENADGLRTVGDILADEAVRIRTTEPDGAELLDRYAVVLNQIQQEKGLAGQQNRDEAVACAHDQGVELKLLD